MVCGVVLAGAQDTLWSRARNEDFVARADAIAEAWGPELARAFGERLYGTALLDREPGLLGIWEAAVRRYDLAGLPPLAKAIAQRADLSTLPAPAGLPTLVVHGTADTAIALADGRAMAKRIPGARFVTVPGAGHCVPLEDPERFAGLLAGFLRRHKLPA
jgi:pimeloyl-ACP methyl ester carboxylesterase